MQYSEKQHKYKFCTNVYWHLITGGIGGLSPPNNAPSTPKLKYETL